MAWVADASLAAGVSNAGGLGIIAAMNSNGEQLRAEIRKCREMTDKPFGVNIMLMSPFVEETAKVVIEEKVPVITTGARQSQPVYGRLAGSRHQGHSGCGFYRRCPDGGEARCCRCYR